MNLAVYIDFPSKAHNACREKDNTSIKELQHRLKGIKPDSAFKENQTS